MMYKIHVATDPGFKDIVYYHLDKDMDFTSKLKGLEFGVQYYWRVKTVNEFTGAESEWSDVCQFHTKGEDIFGQVTPSKIIVRPIEFVTCPIIGVDLNHLRADVTYPVLSGSCQFFGVQLSATYGREVGY